MFMLFKFSNNNRLKQKTSIIGSFFISNCFHIAYWFLAPFRPINQSTPCISRIMLWRHRSVQRPHHVINVCNDVEMSTSCRRAVAGDSEIESWRNEQNGADGGLWGSAQYHCFLQRTNFFSLSHSDGLLSFCFPSPPLIKLPLTEHSQCAPHRNKLPQVIKSWYNVAMFKTRLKTRLFIEAFGSY